MAAAGYWRLIVSGALPGAINMALDEAVLEAVCRGKSAPTIRFYQWRQPTLSLGYAQSAVRSVNLEFCRQHGISLVRRITGGRSVLHDCELTYAVISPDKNAVFPGGIQANYQVIAGVMQKALGTFGIAAALASGREHRALLGAGDYRRNVCFHAPSLHELTVSGCKIAGSAQTRRQGCFLQHGSLPLKMDLKMLAGALNPSGKSFEMEGESALADSVGWVNRFAGCPVSADDLRQAFTVALGELWGVTLRKEDFCHQELERASTLERYKYLSEAWTFERQAPASVCRPDYPTGERR